VSISSNEKKIKKKSQNPENQRRKEERKTENRKKKKKKSQNPENQRRTKINVFQLKTTEGGVSRTLGLRRRNKNEDQRFPVENFRRCD
jgi:hypothetical protein